MRTLIRSAFLATLMLNGCALLSPKTSYVSDVSEADAAVLAKEITAFLGGQLPPAATNLVLQPPQFKNTLTPVLASELRGAGFGVAEPASAPADAHRTRYRVSAMDTGILLRLPYDQKEASRWFARDSKGQLQAQSPFTVRETP